MSTKKMTRYVGSAYDLLRSVGGSLRRVELARFMSLLHLGGIFNQIDKSPYLKSGSPALNALGNHIRAAAESASGMDSLDRANRKAKDIITATGAVYASEDDVMKAASLYYTFTPNA